MSFFSFPNSHLCAFQFHCQHYRVQISSKSSGSSNEVRVFSKVSLQQSSTIRQVEHSTSSVKGNRRFLYNSLASSGQYLNKQEPRLSNRRIPGQRNRSTSKLQDKGLQTCRFCSTLFCSSNNKWYITCHKDSSSQSIHKYHHLVNHDDLFKHKNELSKDVRNRIKQLVQDSIAC